MLCYLDYFEIYNSTVIRNTLTKHYTVDRDTPTRCFHGLFHTLIVID